MGSRDRIGPRISPLFVRERHTNRHLASGVHRHGVRRKVSNRRTKQGVSKAQDPVTVRSGPVKRPSLPPRGVTMHTTAPAALISAPRQASNAPSGSMIVMIRPSCAVKIPAPPADTLAANATVPRPSTDGKRPRDSNRSPVSATVPEAPSTAEVDALGAVAAVGPEHNRPIVVDHRQAMESAPHTPRLSDGGDPRVVACEDAAHPCRTVGAKGDGAGPVHAGPRAGRWSRTRSARVRSSAGVHRGTGRLLGLRPADPPTGSQRPPR